MANGKWLRTARVSLNLLRMSIIVFIISVILSSVTGRSIDQITSINKNTTCIDGKEDVEISIGTIADSKSYCEVMICSGITMSTSVKSLTARVDCQQIFKLLPISVCSMNIGFRFPHCCSECVNYRKKNHLADKIKYNYGSMTFDQMLNTLSNIVPNLSATTGDLSTFNKKKSSNKGASNNL